MIFNDMVADVLDGYKNETLTQQDALTKLNRLLDYVKTSEAGDHKRDRKNNESKA